MLAHFICSEKTILFTSATVLMVLVYPIYDDRHSRSSRRIFAPLQKEEAGGGGLGRGRKDGERKVKGSNTFLIPKFCFPRMPKL